jgi:L-fuculose-phosphate aldolase
MKRNIKEEIVEIGKRLYNAKLNGGYGGNFSVRDEDFIYITPSGLPKDKLDYTDIVVIDFKGNVVEGQGKPSSEILFHILIYKKRKDINAIIHAHPAFATGFSIAQVPIEDGIHEESCIVLGKVPVIPYEVTSSKELAEKVGDIITNHDAALLANHGAIAVGEDLERAFRKIEELELLCKMITIATIMGGVKKISEEKLALLRETMIKRAKRNDKA